MVLAGRMTEMLGEMENGGRQTSISCLSADLLPVIFSRLSVVNILQLRCVCKLWNAIVSSAYTCPLQWGHLSQVLPWIIYYSTSYSIVSLDLSCSRWFTIPISPPASGCLCTRPVCPTQGSFRLAASCAGLLCFIATCTHASTLQHLFVCNPIIKAYRALPQLQLSGPFVHGMYATETADHYVIFVAKKVPMDDSSTDEDGSDDATAPAIGAYYNSSGGEWHYFSRIEDMPFTEMKELAQTKAGSLFSGPLENVFVGSVYNSLQQLMIHLQIGTDQQEYLYVSSYEPRMVYDQRRVVSGKEIVV